MDDVLWKRLKIKAAEDGCTVSELVEAGVMFVLSPARPDATHSVMTSPKELTYEAEQ